MLLGFFTKIWSSIGGYLIAFLAGIAVTCIYVYSRQVVVPGPNKVIVREIKTLKKDLTELDKKYNDLEKNGADKTLTNDPVKYWSKGN